MSSELFYKIRSFSFDVRKKVIEILEDEEVHAQIDHYGRQVDYTTQQLRLSTQVEERQEGTQGRTLVSYRIWMLIRTDTGPDRNSESKLKRKRSATKLRDQFPPHRKRLDITRPSDNTVSSTTSSVARLPVSSFLQPPPPKLQDVALHQRSTASQQDYSIPLNVPTPHHQQEQRPLEQKEPKPQTEAQTEGQSRQQEPGEEMEMLSEEFMHDFSASWSREIHGDPWFNDPGFPEFHFS